MILYVRLLYLIMTLQIRTPGYARLTVANAIYLSLNS